MVRWIGQSVIIVSIACQSVANAQAGFGQRPSPSNQAMSNQAVLSQGASNRMVSVIDPDREILPVARESWGAPAASIESVTAYSDRSGSSRSPQVGSFAGSRPMGSGGRVGGFPDAPANATGFARPNPTSVTTGLEASQANLGTNGQGGVASAPDREETTNRLPPEVPARRNSAVVLALLFSLALNLFLAWITWDTHYRYQDLVDDLEEMQQRRGSSRSEPSSGARRRVRDRDRDYDGVPLDASAEPSIT